MKLIWTQSQNTKSKHKDEFHFFIPAINNYTILCYNKHQKHQLPKNESNGDIWPPPWKNYETLLGEINEDLNK